MSLYVGDDHCNFLCLVSDGAFPTCFPLEGACFPWKCFHELRVSRFGARPMYVVLRVGGIALLEML